MKKMHSLAIMATTVVLSLLIVTVGTILILARPWTEQSRVAFGDVLPTDRKNMRDASLLGGSTKTSGQWETTETEQRVPLEEEYTSENP